MAARPLGERQQEGSTCGQPQEWPRLHPQTKHVLCCAVMLFLLPPKLQQAQAGDLFLGFLAWQ